MSGKSYLIVKCRNPGCGGDIVVAEASAPREREVEAYLPSLNGVDVPVLRIARALERARNSTRLGTYDYNAL
jgi:hypothetical protein